MNKRENKCISDADKPERERKKNEKKTALMVKVQDILVINYWTYGEIIITGLREAKKD